VYTSWCLAVVVVVVVVGLACTGASVSLSLRFGQLGHSLHGVLVSFYYRDHSTPH